MTSKPKTEKTEKTDKKGKPAGEAAEKSDGKAASKPEKKRPARKIVVAPPKVPVPIDPNQGDGVLRQRVREAIQRVENSYFDCAEALHAVYEKAAYVDWIGPIREPPVNDDEDGKIVTRKYKTFKEYAENEVGVSGRKADYLVSIHRFFVINLKMEEALIGRLKSLGWSKCKELIGVVDLKNADEWIEKAESMTVTQLAEECRAAMKGGQSPPSEVTRKSFTLMDDQIEIVDEALKHAGTISDSDKDGNLLTLVCQGYLASAVRPTTGSTKRAFLRQIERTLGMKLIGVDVASKTVVYGKDVFASLSGEAPSKTDEEEEEVEDEKDGGDGQDRVEGAAG